MSSFTCITCRVAFQDADLQRTHYKTDWHRYNLKRKVADLPPVTAENFQERLLAQRAQVETESKDTSTHCAVCNKHFSNESQYQNHVQSKKHKDLEAKQAQKPASEVDAKNAKNVALERELSGEKESFGHRAKSGATQKSRSDEAGSRSDEAGLKSDEAGSRSDEAGPSGTSSVQATNMDIDDDQDSEAGSWEIWEGEALVAEECLFCSHVSNNVEKNIKHMTVAHSFFLPDIEYVSHLEGLLTYLGEKVGEGHICLWCNEKSRSFRTTKAVQQHMLDKGHCKMLHQGDTVFEYADYYDYRTSYPDYVPGQSDKEGEEAMEDGDEEVTVEELDGDSFQLVLPSGSVIGHRSLQRYYRQKLRPARTIALRNPSAVSRVMAQYKALGWTGTTGQMAQIKAKDMAHFHRVKKQKHMMLGVKANKLQKHFRCQVFGAG